MEIQSKFDPEKRQMVITAGFVLIFVFLLFLLGPLSKQELFWVWMVWMAAYLVALEINGRRAQLRKM